MKTGKKTVSEHFWKTLTKKPFFERALPIKIRIFWRQRLFHKNFRVDRPKKEFKKLPKGDSMVCEVVESPRGAELKVQRQPQGQKSYLREKI